jgi:hypothetical protein
MHEPFFGGVRGGVRTPSFSVEVTEQPSPSREPHYFFRVAASLCVQDQRARYIRRQFSALLFPFPSSAQLPHFMAGRRDSPRRINPYDGLEAFDAQQTIAPPDENLIDLSSVDSINPPLRPVPTHRAAVNANYRREPDCLLDAFEGAISLR